MCGSRPMPRSRNSPAITPKSEREVSMGGTAIVTGSARGIGRACAFALARKGVDIALVDLLESEMTTTARDLEALGIRTLTYKADVSDFTRAHEIVSEIVAAWGQLDVLVNNAGAPNPKPILEITEHEFDRTIAVNLKSCFNFIHAAAPVMLRQDTGGDHLDLIDQCTVGRRNQRCQQACLCRGQGRNFGPHPVAGKGARAQSVGQCDLP